MTEHIYFYNQRWGAYALYRFQIHDLILNLQAFFILKEVMVYSSAFAFGQLQSFTSLVLHSLIN